MKPHVAEPRDIGRRDVHKHRRQPPPECYPRRRAEGREHERLGQALPDQSGGAGTERQAHRHLAAPSRRAREQQVRDVGARDEQHSRDRAEQYQQRRLRRLGV